MNKSRQDSSTSSRQLEIQRNCPDSTKLENIELEENSSNESAGSNDTVIDLATASPDSLPCENPVISRSGVAVYGSETSSTGKVRSASTSVNRVEFPADLSSTLQPVPESTIVDKMGWDEGQWTGYKLNCHKRKKKVESLIELYDKDCVNSVQDKDIYKDKLAEISTAAHIAMDYINDLILELEVENQQDRIDELETIKKAVKTAVTKNEKEVKAEMDKILQEAAATTSQQSSSEQSLSTSNIQQLLAALNLRADTGSAQISPLNAANLIDKLKLRQKNIFEDAADFSKVILEVQLASELTDSEVMYYMKESKVWDKRISDLVSANRKFQEEALGIADLDSLARALEEKISIVKTMKENKIAAIAAIDKEKGLNSLCENKNRASIVFPEPFKGNYGENIYKFKEEIVAAIKDSQVKKSDEVRTLLKYLKGEARSRVGDHQPSLEAALDVLVEFYGNTNLIWMKCKQDFQQSFSGDINKHWGDLGSTKRVDAIAKVMEFIRQAQQYAKDYPQLKDEIISSSTLTLLTSCMPVDYLERVFLAIETTDATPKDKIDKMQEILGKLKTCGILAVNQIGSRDTPNKPEKSKHFSQLGTRNPLGQFSTDSSMCPVDLKHSFHKSTRCEPEWGLLGCAELYRLKTVSDRATYCKESKCCFVCGLGDLSEPELKSMKHVRCNYNNPTDRFHTKCTAIRFVKDGKKVYCYYGAALCPDHQSKPNTSRKLLDWLKEKNIKHEMFTLHNPSSKLNKTY